MLRQSTFGEIGQLFRGLLHAITLRKLIEMCFNFVKMHDIDILMMQVEKIDLMDELRAVERAFLDD